MPVSNPEGIDAEILEGLRCAAFNYFRSQVNPRTGLIADKTQLGSPSSIAAVGMALSVYVMAIERELLSRSEAIDRTLTLLKFLRSSHQGPEADATGYKGFYYHFLDMQTGRRALQCELSTIDTAILLAGVLTAASYFAGESNERSRDTGARGKPLSACGLAMGFGRWDNRLSWLEARVGISAVPMGYGL